MIYTFGCRSRRLGVLDGFLTEASCYCSISILDPSADDRLSYSTIVFNLITGLLAAISWYLSIGGPVAGN